MEALERQLEQAAEAGELVVLDWYNVACGACHYILPLYNRICKREGNVDSIGSETSSGVRFLKVWT